MSKFRNTRQDSWMDVELNPEMDNEDIVIWVVAILALCNLYTWVIGAGIAFWNLTRRKRKITAPPKAKGTSAIRLTWRGKWQEDRRQRAFAEAKLHSDPKSRVEQELTAAKKMILGGAAAAAAGVAFGANLLTQGAAEGGLLAASDDSYLVVAMGAGGLAFLAGGVVRIGKYKRFARYLPYIDKKEPIEIDALAAELRLKGKTVFDDFDEMMGRHFILEGCLDTEQRTLTFTEEE